MLFMVIERFRDNDMIPIYQRVRDGGRSIPEGLSYVDSWVEPNFGRCFQLMETNDPQLLQRWIAQWSDIVDFEVYPVITSKEAADRVLQA